MFTFPLLGTLQRKTVSSLPSGFFINFHLTSISLPKHCSQHTGTDYNKAGRGGKFKIIIISKHSWTAFGLPDKPNY
jgi:hypothetical protein